MRVKLDENLGRGFEALLASNGHDVESVSAEGLAGSDDDTVAEAARRERRMLVSLDVEFGDITRFPPGSHPGIVVLRLPESRPSLIRAALSGLIARHHLDDLAGCTVIAQLGAVRIRRPED
ncbi:MAG: DUF5615 family PIN-like protein [Candidatus Dormiibacterota bacterium]